MKRNFINEIKKIALEYDWKIAFGGKSYGNKHLFRVVKIAKELAKIYKADIDVVTISAWLHDIGLAKDIKNHEKEGAKLAREILRRLGFDETFIEKVAHCIEAHEGKIKPKTLEAKIVHDADVLDKCGPLGIIRHTWKLSQQGLPVEKIITEVEKELKRREKLLQLPISKKIAKKLNSQVANFFKIAKKQLRGLKIADFI